MNYKKLIPVLNAIATLSRDPSTKVGAIIFDDYGAILASGFNGFCIGVNDLEERYTHREVKYKFISHAEASAIAFSARNGVRLLGANLIVTNTCCSSCAKLVIQSGIKRVYIPKVHDSEFAQRWSEDIAITKTMFNEANIEVIEYES